MDKTTRREFIFGAVAVAAIVPFAGGTSDVAEQPITDEVFEDIRVDRYYILKGGQYGDTGGIGCPGFELGIGTVKEMAWQKYCNMLDRWMDNIEDKGFYLEVVGYFGPDDAKPFGRIRLNRDWLMKFYNLHKNETKEDWERKYGDYLESLHWPKASLSKLGTLTI